MKFASIDSVAELSLSCTTDFQQFSLASESQRSKVVNTAILNSPVQVQCKTNDT